MQGLSQDLYIRCRDTLLRCREFDSDRLLRVVFIIDELAPFHNALSEAANKSERVDMCLAALLPKYLRDGQPVLPLFLEVLRDRYPEDDALHNELGAIVEAVRPVVTDQSSSGSAQETHQVFISYKRNAEPDEPLAMYLARYLSDRNKKVFIDERLTVGMDWVNEIHDQIAQSDFLVVLLSPDAVKSEMILEEVKFSDMQWRETGRPRILPVRLGYEGPLPYQLDEYLRPLQYILWASDLDTPTVARRILNAVEGNQHFGLKSGKDDRHTTSERKRTVGGQPIAEPDPNYDPRPILEAPEGVVDLESPFYIERPADDQLKAELLRLGTTTTIRAGRQMGKTSLLVRGMDAARQQGSPIVFFDFQMIDSSYLQDLDVFLHYLALNIAMAMAIDPDKVEDIWRLPLSPKDRLTRLLEYHTLQSTTHPVVLAFDEADRLFESPFRQEFFSLVRAWFTMRSVNRLWKKLNVALVISTQPYLLIDDIHQSPFNVGLKIELGDFTPEQIHELNDRHGNPLNQAEELQLMTLLGGHPYLVRQALYTLVSEEMTWSELTKIAIQKSSPFSSHLRQLLWQLRDKPQLIEAIKGVLTRQIYSDELILTRLVSAGLILEDEEGLYRCRCQLYEEYFRRFLS